MNLQRIYLDHAATTLLRSEVEQSMHAASDDARYNPSSLHAEGRRCRALLEAARDRVSSALGAMRTEITFTSSGTESDNQALLGMARATAHRGHVVVSAFEHHAVLEAADRLRVEGWELTALPIDGKGQVCPAVFAGAIRPETVVASVMYANNEIGTIQPIAELAKIARERGVYFHTDAISAPSYLSLDVDTLGVDLLSVSAHKFGGPKGIGALYTRRGVPMMPILCGGGQESGRRSGTENVLGAVGLAQALELATKERLQQSERIAALRNRLEAGIRLAIPDVEVNGAEAARLPNLLNISFGGTTSAALLVALDLAGIAASAGSACTSGVLQPSHVLAALGIPERRQTGAIRFSLGITTQSSDIERVLSVLPGLIADLRAPAPAVRF